MKENYPKAYTEVLELLKYMPENDVNKIPKKLLDIFEYKKDTNYSFIIDKNQDFSKLKILDETEAIMVNIFRDYWASPEQKAKIKAKMQNDMKIIEEEKRARYNPDKLFAMKSDKEIEKCNNAELPIIVKKEHFYNKIINAIKKILHI